MASVPAYIPNVNERPILQTSLTSRASPDDMGASIGRGLEGLAQGAQQAATVFEDLKQFEDLTVAKERQNLLADFDLDAQYGPNGILTLQGKPAVEGLAKYRADLEAQKRALGLGLTPGAAQAFGQAADARIRSSLAQASAHSAQERRTWMADASTARMTMLAQDAMAAWDKPDRVASSITMGIAELGDLAAIKGWDADTLRSKQHIYSSSVLSGVVEQMALNDPIGAAEYVFNNRAGLTPDDGLALITKLQPMVEEAAARDAAQIPENVTRTFSAPDVSQGATDARAFLTDRLVTKGRTEDVDGLDGRFANNLATMFKDSPFPDLGVLSGARSPERQAGIVAESINQYVAGARPEWERDVAAMGPVAAGAKWQPRLQAAGMTANVAMPGRSNHQHGNAVDISYQGKSLKHAPAEVLRWVHDNAARYGLSFPMGHEPWHVEPTDARSGNAGTAKASDITFSPRVASLLDQMPANSATQVRESAIAQLVKERTAVAVQTKAEYATYKDAIGLGILTGEVTSEQAILSDTVLDDGDKETLLRSYRTETQATAGARNYLTGLSDGTSPDLNPFSADDQTIADKSFSIIMEAVKPEQQMAAVIEFVTASQMIPKDLVSDVRMGLASSSPQDVAESMQFAAMLADRAPMALGNVANGQDIREAAATYAELVGNQGMSVDQAAARVIEMRDPANIAKAEVLKTIFDQAVKDDKFRVADVLGSFGANWFGGPAAGVTPYQEAALTSDYLLAAERALKGPAHGDVAIARTMALAEIKQTYSVSSVSGREVLMKFAPEALYPPINGSQSYIRDLALADARSFAPDVANVMLMANSETAADVRAGKPPKYDLWAILPDGVIELVPGQFVVDQASMANLSRLETEERKTRFEIDRAYNEALRARQNDPLLNALETAPGGLIDPPSPADIVPGYAGYEARLTDIELQRRNALGQNATGATVLTREQIDPRAAAIEAERKWIDEQGSNFGIMGGSN